MSIGGVVLQFSVDSKKAVREIDKITHAIKKVGDHSDKSGSKLEKMGKAAKYGAAGIAAGAAVGVTAIAGLLTKSVSLAATFEESQNVLQSSLGATGEEMKKLSDLAKKLGASTVFSAQDASDAMVELAKAGQSAATIMDGSVAAAMALAATEGIELADASKYLTTTMSQFGIKAKKAAKIADILAAGATASVASVQDLAQGLKYSGSTAKNLKLPLKTVVTVLAALNNKGLDASTAGTSFNRFLLGLIPKSELAGKTMKALRTEFQETDGSLKSLPAIIKELDAGLSDLPDPVKMKALKDMFGVEGARAAIGLMDLGVEGYKALGIEVDKTGRAAEMAEARTKGFKGAMEKLGGAAETIGIKIGEKLLPTLTGWIESFTDWVDTPAGTKFFDDIADGVETAAENIKTYVEDTLVPALQKVYQWFGSEEGQDAMRSWGDAIKTVADAIAGLASAFGTLGRAYDKLPDWFKKLQAKAFELLGKASLPGVLSKIAGDPSKVSVTPDQASALSGREKIPTRGTVNVVINNPKPEKATDSAALALRLTRTVG